MVDTQALEGDEEAWHGPDRIAVTTFVDDKWLAKRTCLKEATFRAQRFKRRHSLPHWLNIDPVMIGSKPRYRLSDALAWLAKREGPEP